MCAPGRSVLTGAALLRAHFLGAQVGAVVVGLVEVVHLLFVFLEEVIEAVQHRVRLFLVIQPWRRKKNNNLSTSCVALT